MRALLAVARLLTLLLLSAGFLLLHAVCGIFGKRRSFSRGMCRLLCAVFGIRVRIVGQPQIGGTAPVFFAANHVSYIDIVALGAQLDAVFIAKSEVAGWALIGWLAKAENTVFITRTRAAIEGTKAVLAGLLKQGRSVIVFAEGTSTDGTTVKPFKPGLFDALYEEGTAAQVQPVAIVLEKIEGKVVGADTSLRNRYAWWRPEDTLMPHLWGFASTTSLAVAIHFLPPLAPQTFADRKELAQAAHRAVLAVVEDGAGLGYNPASDVPVAQLDRAPVS